MRAAGRHRRRTRRARKEDAHERDRRTRGPHPDAQSAGVADPKRRWWLIPGLLLAAAGIASLAAALPFGPALAGTGIGIVAVAAVAMLAVAFAVHRPSLRNRILAGLMALMAAVSIVLLVILLGAGVRG
ncbi:hypothetical protein [Microbacterium sp. Marseille-Q6965]|uniref:hypothetical protein n=1 Tax=Microbacterium sp. Marseille-Q6965 TaxID=2965072 RepID=UPI0021B7E513|nr:hypothetical protein [Microbacterium sp. Marseille-Q6965]